jgi:hypothetical protein
MVASNLIGEILIKDEADASSDHDCGEPSAASRVCDKRPGKIAGPPLTPLPAQELGSRQCSARWSGKTGVPKKTKTTREKLLQQPALLEMDE